MIGGILRVDDGRGIVIDRMAAQMEGAGSNWRAASRSLPLRMAQVIGRSGDYDAYPGREPPGSPRRARASYGDRSEMGRQRAD